MVAEDSNVLPPEFPPPWQQERFVRGHHLYVRDVILDLAEITTYLTDDSKAAAVAYLHLYCDELVYRKPLDADSAAVLALDSLKARLKYIHIYARTFLSTVSGLKKLKLTGAPEVRVQLVTDSVPEQLLIMGQSGAAGCEVFSGPITCKAFVGGTCPHKHYSFGVADAGMSFGSGDSKASFQPLPFVPLQEVMGQSIRDMQILGRDAWRIDNLPQLLNWLFITASIDIMQPDPDQNLVAARLRYIIRCTKGSISKIDMAADAQTLLDTFNFPWQDQQKLQNSPPARRFYVEPLNLTHNLVSLKTQLDTAKDIDKDLETSKTASMTMDVLKKSFGKIITDMSENILSFVDIESLQRRAILDIRDWAAKAQDLEAAALAAQADKLKMEDGIKKYDKEKLAEAEREAILAGIQLVIGIASSSALSVSKFQQLQEGKDAEDGKLKKLFSATIKLSEVAAKVFPPLQAAYEKQTCFQGFGATQAQKDQDTTKTLQDGLVATGGRIASQNAAQQDLNTVNFTGLLAGWDSFKIDSDSFFRILESEYGINKVDGMDDYRKGLEKQIVQGKTMLQAMKNAQESSQAYYRQVAENQARNKRSAELRADVAKLNTTAEATTFRFGLTHANQRRLASLRRSIYLRIRHCILAFIYEFNRTAIPAEYVNTASAQYALRADSSIDQYINIQGHLLKEQGIAQTPLANLQDIAGTLTYSTVEGDDVMKAFQDNWADSMMLRKRVPFNIPLILPVLVEGSRRLRITKLGATFAGLTIDVPKGGGNPRPLLRYRIRLGPEMADVTIPGRPPTFAYFYYKGRGIDKVAGLSLDDGVWQDPEHLYLQPALFCSGEISFPGTENIDEILKQITGIELQFKVQSLKYE